MGSLIVRVISRKAIPDAQAALAIWYKEVSNADRSTPADLRALFSGDAEFVGDKVVFNIAWNRYQLIARVAWRARKVLIKAMEVM